ncbi:MAG TPA: hypothetical protein VIY47_07080 [Ignavibacteriaceae bacterium]
MAILGAYALSVSNGSVNLMLIAALWYADGVLLSAQSFWTIINKKD